MTLMRAALFGVPALLLASPAVAQVNEDTGSNPILPRFETPAPPGSPVKSDCKRKACVYLVNVSGYRVTELRYAVGKTADGQPRWSSNQFDPRFAFYSKRWTAWFKPADLSCSFALKIVMKIDNRDVVESAEFDTCANPTLLFYIRDPREKRGEVYVEPNPGAVPAKP